MSSEPIDRWFLSKDGDYPEMEFMEHGPYVLYDDHLREFEEIKAENERLKEQLNDTNFENWKRGETKTIRFDEQYSNESVTIEEGGTFTGTIKMNSCMWILEGDDRTCVPLCDLMNESFDVLEEPL